MNEEAKSGLGIRDLLKLAKDHWTWVTSFVYIYVSVVGMVDAWNHFNAFGINVFEFAEINDFLLAAFREPQSFFVILIFIVLGILYFLLPWALSKSISILISILRSEASKTKFPNLYKIYRGIVILISICYLLAAPYIGPVIYNDNYDSKWVEKILCDPNRHVNVTFSDRRKIPISPQHLVFLGTTEKFVFFYDNEKKSTVVPIDSILLMEQLFSVDLNAEASRYELAVNLGCSKLMLQPSLEDNNAHGGKQSNSIKVPLTGGKLGDSNNFEGFTGSI